MWFEIELFLEHAQFFQSSNFDKETTNKGNIFKAAERIFYFIFFELHQQTCIDSIVNKIRR